MGVTTARTDRPPITPDGRYVVVRGRLWRASNPALGDAARAGLVDALMAARRAVGRARKDADADAEHRAHVAVNVAKIGLGERGPPWWTDDAPDLNRVMVANTSYAGWYASLAEAA